MRVGRDVVLKALLAVAAVVLAIWALRGFGGFFLPVLTALFLAVISQPVVRFLHERARVPRPLAIVLTLVLDMALLAGFVALVVTSVDGLEEAIPRYQERMREVAHDGVAALQARGVPIGDDALSNLRDTRGVNVVETALAQVAQAVSNSVIVVLLLMFLMFETRAARDKLNVLLGRGSEHFARMAGTANEVQRYLVVKTMLSVLTGVLSGCWHAACGVDFPLLWGLLTFLFNYIPSIGPAISVIPPVLISLLTLGPGGAALVAAGHLSIGFVIGNAVEPRLMGQQLGLSTLVVFVSMFFWGWMWGPIGALYAVPLTMLLRSATEPFEETRWIAVLLGSTEWVDAKRREWGWETAEEREKKERDSLRPAGAGTDAPADAVPPLAPRKGESPAE